MIISSILLQSLSAVFFLFLVLTKQNILSSDSLMRRAAKYPPRNPVAPVSSIFLGSVNGKTAIVGEMSFQVPLIVSFSQYPKCGICHFMG